MKFTEFEIKNFKGIEHITFNLDKSPKANIYTLVGLNESGKTTILEAINSFNPSLSPLELPGTTITDYYSLIPISSRENFNDRITIVVTLKLDDIDLIRIDKFLAANTEFGKVKRKDFIKFYNYYEFKDSKYIKLDSRWDGFEGQLKKEPKKKFIKITDDVHPGAYLFSWGNIPGNDNDRLIEFLKGYFDIEWVKTAKIEKIDDDTTIKLSNGKNSLSLMLNDENTKVNLKINDNRNDEFIVRSEKNELRLYSGANLKLAKFCKGLIPSILYFPNFLFDFPSKILLETKEGKTPRETYYIELIQDILYSLENNINIKTHLIDRINNGSADDKRSLDRLLQRMEQKVTKVVFDAWSEIFNRPIKDTKIKIQGGRDKDGLPFLEFKIEAQDGIYEINERSLGFRWFFTFLLLTQFRPFRKDTPKNIIFLFDEPASNLHSSAQIQLLKRFENLINQNTKIIYTTHSHHLINPKWLESTYVVKNDGLDYEAPESYSTKKTSISIEPYRDFVINNPRNTTYYQPILDVLDYKPSNLENVQNCIFLEGKNDYYTLAYFNEVIFNNVYELNLAPCTGSGNLDTLISLYLGWGKKFIVLLDSDKEGNNQKDRYINEFEKRVEQKIYTLQDIDSNWMKKGLEKLFENSEALKFQQTCYPDPKYNKTHFNRAIQEKLINKTYFDFSQETKDNIRKILTFLTVKINSS
jgi:energy-coupling factor transporter ATP-binding protein EcfA2